MARILRILELLFYIIIGGFLFAIVTFIATRRLGLSDWVGSIFLILLSVIVYIVDVQLIRFYIKSRMSGVENSEDWDSTAGLGIVPKWVSIIGFIPFALLIAAALPWIGPLFK